MSSTSALEVARGYFSAIAAADRQAQRTWYHPDAILTLQGTFENFTRDQAIAWFDDFYAAIPNLGLEIIDLRGDDEVAMCHWRLWGTFDGTAKFQGFSPNGAKLDTNGCDVARQSNGQIVSIKAYTDGMTIARQLGAMPAAGSAAEKGMAAAFNAKTALLARVKQR